MFKTEVQGGTYIRKLIDDLGKEIGIGAHMLELRRIRAGIFDEEEIINLYEFEKAADECRAGNEENLKKMIIPGEIITELYQSIDVKSEIIMKLFNGSPIFNKDLDKKYNNKAGEKICVFSKDKFIGIYNVTNSGDIFAKPEFILQPIK